MNKFFIGLIVISTFITACSKKPVSTTISPASEVSSISPKGLVYSLPKTSLKIKVESHFNSVIPGPYARFAQKYLGLSDIQTSASSSWAIAGISVYPYNHSDLQALFVVEPEEDFNLDFLKISNQGLIIPIGTQMHSSSQKAIQPIAPNFDDKNFLDLSPTAFIAAEQTTHYTRVMQDSSFVRVPVHKSVVIEKTLEDKAKEAAEFIFSLRKRRFELLSGDADFVAEGKAAEAVLKEISRLESEYLTLFIGKTSRSVSTHWFDFSTRKDELSSILFRFSEARGVLSPSDLSGSPVLVSLSVIEQWVGLEILNRLNVDENQLPILDAIYYRIPVPVMVKIHDSKTDFFNQNLQFYQFGPLLRMPSKYLYRIP
jgi:hypothetical protein